MFAGNPFPNHPPRYVRAVYYVYKFASPENAEGAWWQREKQGLWLAPFAADDPNLISIMRQAGWSTTD